MDDLYFEVDDCVVLNAPMGRLRTPEYMEDLKNGHTGVVLSAHNGMIHVYWTDHLESTVPATWLKAVEKN